MSRPRSRKPLPAVTLALLAAIVAAWALTAGPAGGADRAESLRNSIQGKRDREQALSGAASRLDRLERATGREVAILQRRVAAVESDLAAAQAILDRTVSRRNRAQARALRLRARLSQSRAQLAHLLRERYTGGKPDLITVVLESHGFANLLETVEFLRRIQRADQQVLTAVASGRHEALAQRRVLSRLTAQRRTQADVVRRRRDGLAAIAAGLRERRAVLAQARSARLAALGSSRRSRRPRGARADAPARAAKPCDRPGRTGRSVGDPVGDRAVRVRRPEHAAQLGDRVGLLPVHRRHVAWARRLDAARLPGLQGRAGPARGAAVERRQGREQLGLRRARRHPLSSAPSAPAPHFRNDRREFRDTRRVRLHRTRSFIVALCAAGLALPAHSALAADPGPYVSLGDSYTAAPLVLNLTGTPLGCLRSDHNYPSLVAAALGVASFRDVSCSAATTDHMTTRAAACCSAPTRRSSTA